MKDDLQTKKQRKRYETALGDYGRFFIVAVVCIGLLDACDQRKELLAEELYEGPNLEMDSVYTKISDSAKVIVTLRANKERSFQNQDREWPNDLFLEYLDDEGNVKTTFRADYVFYTHKENLYRAEGNVEVVNRENGDKLNTEELFWDPAEETFYTERFVTINTEDEIHTGEGLEANQDFSTYKILKPTGSIRVEQ